MEYEPARPTDDVLILLILLISELVVAVLLRDVPGVPSIVPSGVLPLAPVASRDARE